MIEIYTDGSYKDGKAGGGIYSKDLNWNEAIKIEEPINSNAVAELITINKAITLWKQKQDTINKMMTTIIYTDAKFIVDQIKENNMASYKPHLELIWRRITQNKINSKKLLISWVPSHCGIEGNEQADELAKKGSEIE